MILKKGHIPRKNFNLSQSSNSGFPSVKIIEMTFLVERSVGARLVRKDCEVAGKEQSLGH